MNWEQNYQVQLLPIMKFAYNNFKNANTSYISFKFNCDYYPWIFFKNKYNLCFEFSLANRLATKLRKLINICCQNFWHILDF